MTKYSINESLKFGENGFIFSQSTGETFILNQTAQVVFELLKKNYSTDKIKEYIFEKYNANQNQIEKDLEDLLFQLKNFSIIH